LNEKELNACSTRYEKSREVKKNRIHAKYVAIVMILLMIYWLSFCYQAVDFVNSECHQILLPKCFNKRQTSIGIEGYFINLIECKVGAS
jgi:hypothetical protein